MLNPDQPGTFLASETLVTLGISKPGFCSRLMLVPILVANRLSMVSVLSPVMPEGDIAKVLLVLDGIICVKVRMS